MSNSTNLTYSTGVGTGVGNATLIEDSELCTLQTCTLSLASFEYLPNVPGNAIYAGVFGFLIIAQLYLGIKHRTWGYMIPLILGLILEVVGYVARILLYYSPFSNDAFLTYLITLTIAPAFLSAAVYLCLGRIVHVYGEHLSYFRPKIYTIVFCSCDLVSLILQAAGGGIASSAKTQDDSDLGKNLMLAGLIFQVFSLLLFTLAGADVSRRVYSGRGTWNPRYTELTHSKLFNGFLAGLFIATATISTRCVYRVLELWDGFHGELFVSDEPLFMVLEGVMISIACFCLTFLHPGICFKGAWHEASFKFRSARGEKALTITSDAESQWGQVELNNLKPARDDHV